MLISKFDLYNAEWLDLVFENRNKEYGAYELRQHHDRTMVRAMGVTFFCVAVLSAFSIALRKPLVHTQVSIPVDLTHIVLPAVTQPKKIVPPAQKPLKALPTPPVATKQFVQMVVTPDKFAVVNPTKNDELVDVAIGPETTKGPTGTGTTIPVETAGTGEPAVDNTVHTINGLDLMPTPVGGESAWAKFLNRNLRFPAEAQDAGASGKVILSFVIEKDGSLSDITIVRAAGHGFDEEALRVLKLAKAWKPGYQNGQPVRVRYNIPINFQSASDN